MIFGDRVTQLREKLMLTQEEIASYVGVSVNTVDNWEHGLTSPQKSNLYALAKALQTTADYLEGKTEISTDYSSGGNVCIICGKSIPYGVSKCPECSWRKWPESFLTSDDQATRRKRSHGVNLSYLNREKARATFTSVTSYGVRTYETSLDMCTCPDFEERQKPCKHIFRLAEELGLLESEKFARGERDYTMEFTRYESVNEPDKQLESVPQETVKPAEPEKKIPVVETVIKAESVPAEKKSPGIFMRLLKYAACCFFGFWAVVFTLLAVKGDRTAMCFPVAFAIAGFLTAITAKCKGEKSAFKWWLYGAVVPFVSWIEVTMLNSENKAKSFMKGLAYILVCVVVFMIVASHFLPPVKPKESALPEVRPVMAAVPVSEDVKPLPKVSKDTGLNAEQAAYMAKLREQEREAKAKSERERREWQAKKEREAQIRKEHGEWEAETGREEKEQEAEKQRQVQEYLKKRNTVVVTPKGKKYHEPNCRTVRGSSRTLTIAQAKKRGYTPCKVCDPPSSPVTAENIYWGNNVYYPAGGARLDVD